MKSEVTEVGTCRYKVEVTVDAAQVDAEFDKVIGSIKDRVNIKGFRAGHAPKNVIMRRHGESIARDVLGQLFENSFTDALKEKDLSPLGQPDLDFSALKAEPGKEFAYSCEVDVRPSFDLPEYKGIKLTENVKPIDENEVTERLENIRKGFAVFNESSEPFAKGDAMIADLEMLSGDESIMKREDFRLPADADRLMGLEIEGLQDALAGAKAGDEKSFDVDVPESYYQKDAAGKKCSIKATVKKIERPEYPAMDDEMAKKVGFDTLDGLTARVKESFEAERKNEAQGELQKEILDEILSKVSFDLPEEYINRQVESRIGREKQMLEATAGGEGAEDNKDKIAEMEKNAREEALNTTRRMIVLDAIADKENVEISQEDVWQHIQQMAYAYGMPAEKMLEQIQKMNALMYIAQEVREIKVVKFLLDNADVTQQTA